MNDQDKPGPLSLLQPLLDDATVYEIFVDGYNRVYVERPTGLEDVPSPFRDNGQLLEVVKQLCEAVSGQPMGTRLLLDGRLPDGSHINIVLPPLSEIGPLLSIRKFFRERMEPEDLVNFGLWNETMIEFLNACVAARLNIVIAGGVGAGRAITLTVLAAAMLPEDERIVVIQEGDDVQLPQKYAITLKPQHAATHPGGAIASADLVRNALRMRADRLVVGEVNGPEAFDLVQAMNNGQDGMLFTLQASSPRDALIQLQAMAALSPLAPPEPTLREMVSAAVDLVVHQERLRDGTRRILSIAEVQGVQGEAFLLQELFTFHPADEAEPRHGHFSATGRVPLFLERIEEVGIDLPENLFVARRA